MSGIEKIICLLIALFAAALAIRLLKKGSRKQMEPGEFGFVRLRMHPLYGILGFAALLLCFLLAIGMEMQGQPGIFFLIPALAIGMPGLYTLLYYLNHSLWYNTKTLEVRNWYGKTDVLNWYEVKAVSFKLVFGIVLIRTEDGRTLRVHRHLKGFYSFLRFLESSTELSAKSFDVPGFP
jgi:hypothetical protein